MIDVFNYITSLKDIKRQELKLTKDDEWTIKQYFRVYEIKKLVPYIYWRQAVINVSIEKMILIHSACELIVEKIIKFNGN